MTPPRTPPVLTMAGPQARPRRVDTASTMIFVSDHTDRLPLDSSRWNELWTRMGPGGYPVHEALRALDDDPSHRELFREMWAELCAEETTYDAAFAAVPYLVDLAGRVDSEADNSYLIVTGLITTYAGDVPSDLAPAYRSALERALSLALDRLQACRTNADLRYLLATVAALRGRPDLACVLQDLDAIQEPCPTCGTVVHPSELEAVIDRDQES